MCSEEPNAFPAVSSTCFQRGCVAYSLAACIFQTTFGAPGDEDIESGIELSSEGDGHNNGPDGSAKDAKEVGRFADVCVSPSLRFFVPGEHSFASTGHEIFKTPHVMARAC